ncbi:D-glycero-beta-D-manno-heptose 1-phosphate adenylyltransferase [Nocardioides sp. URHA0020]|uniref:D-glycero-beta-D-manno-heptose 1-phosphate adenylyltransferase n=1 Tax=Nocardioides sp. URHA0020 TaxID=1380392 RepID=UPI00048D8742|nr:D-glycero-beta-D-manno-heptose 1-phosphate adenylyltransferase [Nocardioides sp. URHA0020]
MTAGPVVVLGDALLDIDVLGHAGRLSPDAPVPVVAVDDEVPRPGGAALAAALAARDTDVVLVTALAEDEDGARLRALVEAAGVRVVALPHAGSTPVKRRVRADGQSLVRLDHGGAGPIDASGGAVVDALRSASAVLVSDYGHGLTGLGPVRAALADAAHRMPVVWDPHPRGAMPVPGVRLATPNLAEASALAGGLEQVPPALDGLTRVTDEARVLVVAWRAHAVAVTLGARGALLSHGESSPSVIPAPQVVGAGDACGAGDRFASAATVALASGAVTLEAVQAAVHGAARFVADGGAAAFGRAPVGASQASGASVVERVRAAGGKVVATGGCFDLLHAGHVATLEAARALGDCLVVCLNSDQSVRRLKGPSRPLVPQADRARVLAALQPVDEVVVFEEDTPVEALRRLRPDVWVKGGDYAGAELPEAAILRGWGGQSVVVPYLAGRSTSGLVTAAAGRPDRP